MFDSPDSILRIVRLAQERARLLERLAEIDKELMSSMPTLLTAIAATSQTPLNLRDFMIRVIKSEYRLKGKVDISTVAAAVLKTLVEKGVLKRDRDSQGYVRYVLAANATLGSTGLHVESNPSTPASDRDRFS